MSEHLLGIVLGSIARLALILLGTIANIIRLLLSQTNNLLLARDSERLLLGIGDNRIGLCGGAGHQLIALLEDATRFLPFLRIAHADLVKNIEEDLRFDDLELLVLAERWPCFLDKPLEFVYEAFDPLARKVVPSHPVSLRLLIINR